MRKPKRRVRRIAGIFFKTRNPDQSKNWYKKHLGLDADEYGTCFGWCQSDRPSQKGFSQWSPFPDDTHILILLKGVYDQLQSGRP